MNAETWVGREIGGIRILDEFSAPNRYRMCKCQCRCGKEFTVKKCKIGEVRSCGCLRKNSKIKVYSYRKDV
jgi:hypothetical protein